jgi:quinoprotein glucose dehydrogenase
MGQISEKKQSDEGGGWLEDEEEHDDEEDCAAISHLDFASSGSNLFHSMRMSMKSGIVFAGALIGSLLPLQAAEINAKPKQENRVPFPVVAPASDEGLNNIKKFTYAHDFKIDLIAAEPMLANPVAFCMDEKNNFYVSETYRYRSSVLDIRHYMFMLEDDMAVRNVDDRIAMIRRNFGPAADDLAIESEVVRYIHRGADGLADRSTVYADGFNTMLDGIASGVMARKGKVYFTNIPNLWELQDTDGDDKADKRTSLSYGWGVRFSYTGHDFHGVIMGPDGKLYFSIGDRGANIKTKEGTVLAYPDEGGVYRCNPDGTELEIVHKGLRNPQELAFDNYGNLFTGDNDCDNGDRERWVYIAEGGESGWRVGYQHAPLGRAGAWMSEKLWNTADSNTASYIIPPISYIENGPSGLVHNPGTGFPAEFDDSFFLCHFKGQASVSGIERHSLTTKGASFELVDHGHFVWNTLTTDVTFGYDGAMYFTDWHHDWPKSAKGRIYRMVHPEAIKDPVVAQVKQLFAEGFDQRSAKELARYLSHKDQRVRQESQFALVDKGDSSIKVFAEVAKKSDSQLARIHAIWGLGQLGRKNSQALEPVRPLLGDKDDEVRAQAAKILGDAKDAKSLDTFVKLLKDPNNRVKYFAAYGVGKQAKKSTVGAVMDMLRANNDEDLYLRHAGVMALTWIGDKGALITAAKDSAKSIRLASLLVMRRLEMPEVAMFLSDSDDHLVLEAMRAINDVPIAGAMPKLAALITKSTDVEPVALRVVNANFRVGTPDTAKALAKAAADKQASVLTRTESLGALSRWANPPARDRIMGLYRPLPQRDEKTATAALAPVLNDILKTAPAEVRIAAIQAASEMSMKSASPVIADLVKDTKLEAKVRMEALKALEKLGYEKLAEAVQVAVNDPAELLRKEGNRIQAKIGPKDATVQLSNILDKGTVGEKQGALASLAEIKGNKADQLIGKWVDKLVAGKVPNEIRWDIVAAAQAREAKSVKEKLAKYDSTLSSTNLTTKYRDLQWGGDAANGKKLFYEKVEASCLRCHQINKEGGDVGPHMDAVATRGNREYLLESIVDPNAKIAQGFDTVLVTKKNDTTVAGILKSETADEFGILVQDEDGFNIVKVKKADVKAREKGMSGMPPGFADILPKQDIRDIIEFLTTLK